MSRIVTSSEVDRLHQQVAELLQRVTKLEQIQNSENAALFEDFEVVDSQKTRSSADPVVDVLASELPSAV